MPFLTVHTASPQARVEKTLPPSQFLYRLSETRYVSAKHRRSYRTLSLYDSITFCLGIGAFVYILIAFFLAIV